MRYLINQAASSSNLIDLGEWEWEEGRKKRAFLAFIFHRLSR
jgi:hypothetical protein